MCTKFEDCDECVHCHEGNEHVCDDCDVGEQFEPVEDDGLNFGEAA